MTLTFHALWLLCVLCAVVFATAAAAHVRTIGAMLAGLLAGIVMWSPLRLPDAAMAGALAAVGAALYLFRPRLRAVTAATGGLLAGMFTALLEVPGVPAPVSALASFVLVAVPVWLARTRPSFAPEQLLDEALLLAGGLGLAVAVLPGVLDGWQAATNLAAATERVSTTAVPAWTLLLLLASSSSGALYSLWSRR